MRRSDFVSDKEIKRYRDLKIEADRLYLELQNVTENTGRKDVEKLQVEYANVQQEMEEIGQRISLMQTKAIKKIKRMRTKPDGTDLKAFDDTAEDFFDALYDYYGSCKIRLMKMLNELNQQPDKLSIKQRYQRWKIKREIKHEIDSYTRKQQDCVYRPKR